MKKIILAFALLMSACQTFAQYDVRGANNRVWDRSRTEIRFEQPDSWTNIRDVVRLKNFNQFMVELNRVEDYQYLKDLDKLIYKLREDIKFYEDSLKDIGSGNVRIDYSLRVDSVSVVDIAEMRFKRHSPDGEAFVRKNGEVAKLKLEQDTVNFILRIYPGFLGNNVSKLPYTYSIKASFFVNNYTDIFKIAEDKDLLNHIIDTLVSTKRSGTVNTPYKFPSSTFFKTDLTDKYRFHQLNGIWKPGHPHYGWDGATNRADKLQITLNMGAGLVRNTLAPMAEGGIGWYNMRPAYYTRKFQEDEINTFIGVSATSYFLFDRNPDGNFYVKDNWFVNLEMGGATNFLGLSSPLVTGGVGYLFAQKGDYFKGTTMKAFMNFKIRNGPTISPEVIVTGSFKQVFPGITVKIF